MAEGRYDYVDIAKGIGIFLVVCSHSLCSDLMYFANGFFIPLFFVLSGYTSKTFSLWKKVKTLLVPYVIFNVLIISAAYLSGLKKPASEDWIGVLYSRYVLYPSGVEPNMIFLGAGNAPLWFLTSMFSAFVLFCLLCLSGKHWKWIALAYLLVAWLLDFLPVLLPWSLDTAFLMALFMYAGRLMKEYDVIHRTKWYLIAALLLYAACMLANGYENLSVREYGKSLLLSLVAGVSGSMVLVWLCAWLERTFVKDILIEIGKNSLVIFCFQLPFLHIFRMFLPDSLSGGGASAALLAAMAVLQTLLAVGAGYLTSKVFKKVIPFI